jgi:tubulin polyglutamylase TTLL6/13
MIDKNFKPWLIEVNQSPSFSTDSPLDYDVKKSVVKDTMSLLNINQERKETFIKEKTEQAAERMMTGKVHKLTTEERRQLKEERIDERIDFERM